MSRAMDLVESAFELLARARSARAFHPVGRTVEADMWWDDPASPTVRALGGVGAGAAVARVSKGIGLPGTLPDFLGVAVRLHPSGRTLDVLFTTVGRHGWRRRLLSPARGWCRTPYSTLLPYRAGEEQVTLGLRPLDADGPACSLAALDAALARGQLRLALEELRDGSWRTIGGLAVFGRPVTREPSFDPYLALLPELAPVGFLAQLRERAYVGSRRGRRAAATLPEANDAPRR